MTAKDIIKSALMAYGAYKLFAQDGDEPVSEVVETETEHGFDIPEEPTLVKINGGDNQCFVKPMGDDMVEYVFAIKVDPSLYNSENDPVNENAASETSVGSNQDNVDEMKLGNAHLTPAIETPSMDAAPTSKSAMAEARKTCAADISKCRAKNVIACPYHGAQIVKMDLMDALSKAGLSYVPEIVLETDEKGKETGAYIVKIPCDAPAKSRKALEKVVDDFLKRPGIAKESLGAGTKHDYMTDIDWDNEKKHKSRKGYYTIFEVDALNPYATSAEGEHPDKTEDKPESVADKTEDKPEPVAAAPEPIEEPVATPVEEPKTMSEFDAVSDDVEFFSDMIKPHVKDSLLGSMDEVESVEEDLKTLDYFKGVSTSERARMAVDDIIKDSEKRLETAKSRYERMKALAYKGIDDSLSSRTASLNDKLKGQTDRLDMVEKFISGARDTISKSNLPEKDLSEMSSLVDDLENAMKMARESVDSVGPLSVVRDGASRKDVDKELKDKEEAMERAANAMESLEGLYRKTLEGTRKLSSSKHTGLLPGENGRQYVERMKSIGEDVAGCMENFHENHETQLEKMRLNCGYSTDEWNTINDNIRKTFASISEHTSIGTRIYSRLLNRLISSHLMNQFESDSSEGSKFDSSDWTATNRRAQYSRAALGTKLPPDDVDDFEKYGCLSSDDPRKDFSSGACERASGYGDTYVRFRKDKVPCAVFSTDSSAMWREDHGVTCPLFTDFDASFFCRPGVRARSYLDTYLKGPKTIRGIEDLSRDYMEAQFLKKNIDVTCMESISFANEATFKSSLSKESIEALRSNGVKIFIAGIEKTL